MEALELRSIIAEARLEKKSRLKPARVVAMSWVIGRQVESCTGAFSVPVANSGLEWVSRGGLAPDGSFQRLLRGLCCHVRGRLGRRAGVAG